MFERFTERARQVVILSQEEARTLKHNYIGTEHILLGLLREEHGLAARVLGSFDIIVDRVRAQVVRLVPARKRCRARSPSRPVRRRCSSCRSAKR
jgi:ATP-dependent Clp protease ATP-binding subunit ClpC